MAEDVWERLKHSKVVPVAVIESVNNAVPMAKAILDGGIDVIEITFRTDAAAQAIGQVVKACPQMAVGAGTITKVSQCKTAVDMGAAFIVSPGLDEEIVRWCISRDIPVIPGCVTPSEIMRAMQLGLHVVKYFPANIFGGLDGLKSLAAPFPNIQFFPTGGVAPKNLLSYLSLPFVFAVGGSWICSKDDISNGCFSKIAEQSRDTFLSVQSLETHQG